MKKIADQLNKVVCFRVIINPAFVITLKKKIIFINLIWKYLSFIKCLFI